MKLAFLTFALLLSTAGQAQQLNVVPSEEFRLNFNGITYAAKATTYDHHGVKSNGCSYSYRFKTWHSGWMGASGRWYSGYYTYSASHYLNYPSKSTCETGLNILKNQYMHDIIGDYSVISYYSEDPGKTEKVEVTKLDQKEWAAAGNLVKMFEEIRSLKDMETVRNALGIETVEFQILDNASKAASDAKLKTRVGLDFSKKGTLVITEALLSTGEPSGLVTAQAVADKLSEQISKYGLPLKPAIQ